MAVYTVSQVTSYLREILESDPLLADLYVTGEVSNLTVSGAGHSYFTLKDQQNSIRCVMFKGQTGADRLEDGLAVSTHGHFSFYEPRGTTDFMVDLAMPEGVGELALELERLKLRLEAEGLFEISRKRPLPQFPQVVGVVTSPSGAVFHDIQNVLRRRYPLVELILAPTQVQGVEAAPGIVAGIEGLNREGSADVIIVGRGGGSLEELWPFNEERVARAIYASRIPVVSAVGHETDVTISDLVADVRAPTPSAAAELVVPDRYVLQQALVELNQRTHRALVYQMEGYRSQVANVAQRLEQGLPDWETWRRRVDDLGNTMHRGMLNRLGLVRVEITGLEHRLRVLDPVATLRRGFSVVQRVDTDQVMTGIDEVADGDALQITVADGSIPAVVGTSAPLRRTRKKPQVTPTPPQMERLL